MQSISTYIFTCPIISAYMRGKGKEGRGEEEGGGGRLSYTHIATNVTKSIHIV